MQTENLIDDDIPIDINDYIDSILDNYSNLGKKPCVSILKYVPSENEIKEINQKKQMNIMLMYSATELQECRSMKKHINRCQCCNILYITMILDVNLNLIHTNDNSIYIHDLYDIVLKVIKKFYL